MASRLKRIGDLDIHQDLAFQQRSWTLQRAGWALLVAVMLCGLAGFFGHDPLTHALLDDPALPFSMEYDRFARYHGEPLLRLHTKAPAASGDQLTVWFSRNYLDHFRIERMTPEPSWSRLTSDGTLYSFALQPPATGGTITIHVRPEGPWSLVGSVGATPDQSIAFWQWIHP